MANPMDRRGFLATGTLLGAASALGLTTARAATPADPWPPGTEPPVLARATTLAEFANQLTDGLAALVEPRATLSAREWHMAAGEGPQVVTGRLLRGTISAIAADDIEPTSHALPLTNVFRDDVVVPSLSAEAALSGAPQVEEQRFAVPKILGEE